MRRKRPLVAELLEGRTLLSSLSYSLTTDQPVYQVGQTIQLTFTETNISNQPVTVEVSPTDFEVSQNNNGLWQSGPGDGSQPPVQETLQPGQSVQQTATWDGTTPDPFNGPINSMTPQMNNFGTFSVSNPNGPQGLSATFQIPNPIANTVTTDKPVYQLGQPVEVTFTEVNTASVPITIYPSAPEEADIFQNGNALWVNAYPQVVSVDPLVLRAGQTITGTSTFNIIPATGPYTLNNLTGTFVAGVGPQDDPTMYTASFQVVAPSENNLVTSVTTDQSTYDFGQPVNMNFTETNNGDQPIVILTGATSFQISQNGTTVWDEASSQAGPIAAPSWTTLQPGQSYTQTASWDGLPNEGPFGFLSGDFTLSNVLDPSGSSASFQVIGPISVPPYIPAPDPPVVQPTPVTKAPQPPNVQPTPPPSSTAPVTVTLVSNRNAYKTGQSVRLSMTVKNLSTAKVAMPPNAGPDRITVMDGSTVVFRSARIRSALIARSIKPHHSIELALSWSGRPNQSDIAKLAPGTYTVQVVDGGFSGTTTIRLVR